MPVPSKGCARLGKRLLCYTVALVGAIAAPLVFAVSIPDAGQLLNEHQQTLPSEPRSTEPAPAFELPSDRGRPAVSGLRVQLKEIDFSGDTELAQAESLQALVKPVLGQTFDHAGLQQLADSITRYLRGRGYVLARAYLPRQDLTEGKLQIALVKGRLQSGTSRIELNGNTRSSNDRLRQIADAALPEGKVLQAEDLERALLLINDQPGVSAQSALERGTEPGTSRLLINAKRGALLNGGVSMDNYGNRSTGTARANAQLNVNDPLGMGDQLSIDVSKSTGSDIVGGAYSVPLTATGVRLNASASYLRYEVDQEQFRPLDLNGTARSGSLGLSYPLIRSRLQNLNLSATYEYKALEDRGLGTSLRDRELNNFIVALNGNRFDSFAGGGVTDALVTLTLGELDLSGNRDDRLADSVSAQSDGSFRKLNLRLSRLQSLGAASPWTLFGGVSAQWAGDNLDSSEKFLLGGPAGVRAYPVGEASADQGWLATLELRRNIDLGLPSVTMQGLGFFDSGRVWLNENPWPGSINNAGETNRYDLHAVGLGANVWANDFSVRTAVARTLGNNPGQGQSGLDADGRDSHWRAWIQVSYAF